MKSAVYIYEDNSVKNFNPLALTRPVYELLCGILTLKEKIAGHFPHHEILCSGRNTLAKVYNFNKFPDLPEDIEDIVLLNGRVLINSEIANIINFSHTGSKFSIGGKIAAVKIKFKYAEKYFSYSPENFSSEKYENLNEIKLEGTIAQYPWDLINANGEEIINDFKFLTSSLKDTKLGKIHKGAHLINETQIFFGKNSSVKPGCILDAEKGPIYIDENVEIFPNAVIEGPAYIGKNSKIKIGAKIYENTSIGNVCKIGGEIEQSIIHSYSNKQHDGFLGHSYLGSWVNLGADTNTSDLKNNYSNVSMTINEEIVDSGTQFLGAIIGDHSKTSINTMINTGTNIGVSCNIFGADFPPKYIPSFSWGGSNGLATYKLGKAVSVAQKVCSRRKIVFNDFDIQLFQNIFDNSASERIKRGMEE